MMILKKKIRISNSDKDKIRSLRMQVESLESSYNLGLCTRKEYNILKYNIVKQVEELEVKYGIKQYS